MATEVRLAHVVKLGRERDGAAGPALVRVLVDDPSPEVRARAAWALGRVAYRQAVPSLRAALAGDQARQVRREAALALGDVGGPEAVDTLAGFVADADDQVAAAAVEGLGRAKPSPVPRALQDATRDARALVSLTAKRTLSLLAPPGEPRPASRPLVAPWCTGAGDPAGCRFRRGRSDGANADGVFVLGSALVGGLAGAWAPDGMRAYRRGVRVTPRRTLLVDNGATPLERAVGGGLGVGAAVAAAGLYTWWDDVTASRAGLVALLAAEGAGMGAALALATARPRHQAVAMVTSAGLLTSLAATALTWVPHDFSYGDVAWVYASAAMGFAVGALSTLALVPTHVGAPRGREGRISDVGDLLGTGSTLLRLPFGEVGRTELVVASGLAGSALAPLLAATTLPLYEVGVGRALKTAGAFVLVATLLAVPPMLLLPEPPAPLPTPERVGAGTAILGGLAAGALTFALSSNDDGQGPLFVVDLPGVSSRTASRGGRPAVVLGAPSLAVAPPSRVLGGEDGGGVYLGLVNARF
jgi:hypothetical protein